MNGDLVIGVQDDGGKATIAHFKNAKLAGIFFETKSPKVMENFQSCGRASDIDDLDLLGPIEFVQKAAFAHLREELGKQILAFLAQFRLVLLPVGIRHCMIKKGLNDVGRKFFIGAKQELEVVLDRQCDRRELKLRRVQKF